MGNEAAKQLKSLDLSTTTAPPLALEQCIDKALPPVKERMHFSVFVTKTVPQEMELKSDSGVVVLSTKAEPGGRVTTLYDSKGSVTAVSKKQKQGLRHAGAIIYRTEATFSGQTSTDLCQDSRTPLYPFASIDVKMGAHNKCTYGVFRDAAGLEPIYTGAVASSSTLQVLGTSRQWLM